MCGLCAAKGTFKDLRIDHELLQLIRANLSAKQLTTCEVLADGTYGLVPEASETEIQKEIKEKELPLELLIVKVVRETVRGGHGPTEDWRAVGLRISQALMAGGFDDLFRKVVVETLDVQPKALF